jgi:hypothetical protein
MTMDQNNEWQTLSFGNDIATVDLSQSQSESSVFLRVAGDFSASGTKQAQFSYSFDGKEYSTLGTNFTMVSDWEFFQAYRFAIFNYATKDLGGSVVLNSFELEAVA